MATFISHSPAETQKLGEAWGQEAKPGLVLALSGDMGSGKTQLVKGFARGLGIQEPVQSPSFALVHVYSTGRLPLYHLDLYRLETSQQIIGAGLDQYLETDGVAVIEWAERWFDFGVTDAPAQALPGFLRRVRIGYLDNDVRQIDYEDPGA